jgi:hypothetical protein
MTQLAYRTPPVAGFKDRSTTVLVVGIFFIIAGALCGCGLLMMPMALLAPRPANAPPPPQVGDLVLGGLVYAMLCTAFLWVGIGCVRKQRWVRPIVIVLAWIALAGGVMGMLMWVFMLPRVGWAMRRSLPPGAAPPPAAFFNIMIALITGVMVLLYLVIPAALLWLFRPPDVRATLEHYDPRPRWTDGVPLGVLGVCALLALGGIGMLLAAVQGWIAAFGIVVGGAPARLSALAVAIAFAAATWMCFQRRATGWWLAMALFILVPLAWATTLLRHDLPQVYMAMGRPEHEVRMMEDLHRRSGTWMALGTMVMSLAVAGFAWRVRNHFLSRDLQIPQTPSPQSG